MATLLPKIDVFESSQVVLNIEYLSLIPSSINQSSFFNNIAEEMELTVCEQIENGCPVLLGMWGNIVKAEKQLTRFLQVWEEDSHALQQDRLCTDALQQDPLCLVTEPASCSSDNKSHSEQDSCDIETLILPTESSVEVQSSSTAYASAVLTSPPQLYIVSSDEMRIQPQLLHCALANVTAESLQSSSDKHRKETLGAKSETNTELKELYVNIAVRSLENSAMKIKTSSQCLDMKSSSDQDPLDKLCHFLCIEEDETIEKRICATERRRKLEEKFPFKYFCDLCSFKAKRENHLLKHAKLHEKIKDLFCCDQCDFKTIRESVLCRHKMDHSPTKLFCKLCPYKTYSKKFMSKHVRARHISACGMRVKCPICEYVAATPRELNKHKNILHKPDIGTKFWKCSKCPYKSKLKAHLKRHENDMHGNVRQFLCHYCGKSFKRNDTLTQHKTIHGEINKTFTCQHCGKVCTSSVFLREHLTTHTTERPFLCDMCGTSFKTKAATLRHKRQQHSGTVETFACPECERTFKTKADLNKHRKTHRIRTEATIVPAAISGANVQGELVSAPITIQVMYSGQMDANNHQDVAIK